MKKLIFFYFLGLNFLSAQINVYDTLEKVPYFSDYLHHDNKKNYFLNNKKQLVREYHLTDGALHFNKDFEDSLFTMLKLLFNNEFVELVYKSEENVRWILPGGEKFRLRHGKKISQNNLARIFASEAELKRILQRPAWLQKEDDFHLFFHRYFLAGKNPNTVFCFNDLSGYSDGDITTDKDGHVVSETGRYDNGKLFYQLINGTMEIFNEKGVKIFEKNSTTLFAFNEDRSLKWEFRNNQFFKEQKPAAEKLNIEQDYYKIIEALWRKNFAD